MEDLNQKIFYPISFHCDNQSVIRLAENSVFHARTKHVEVHSHFIRESSKERNRDATHQDKMTKWQICLQKAEHSNKI